jgi:hypothetical protein
VIESDQLDWRPNLNVPEPPYPVSDDLHTRARQIRDRLALRMGVIELKETPDGELVRLEVNPQGQFLFLEGLVGMQLADEFADFLIRKST